MLNPIEGENIFVCGECYSKKQGWIEGALETTYDILEKLKIEDISFYRTVENDIINIDNNNNDYDNKINDLYNIYDVIQNENWIVLETDDKKFIYDFTNCFKKQCSTKSKLFQLIEANKYYIDNGENPKYKDKPIDIFLKYESNTNLNKYLKNNKFVKKVGILI